MSATLPALGGSDSLPRDVALSPSLAPWLSRLRRLSRLALYLAVASAIAILSSPAKATESQLYSGMVGAVINPASLTLGSDPTAPQSLANTSFTVNVGTLPAGLSWATATLTLYINHGSYVTATPSVTFTDATGAALSVTATATTVGTTTNGAVNYQLSGDLPANSVLHFTGFVLSNLTDVPGGAAIQILAAAHANDRSWRGYSTFQTLATIGSGGSGGSSSLTPQTGWWWSSAEPGRGYALEAANDRMMFAAYMYRSDGTSVWYVANGAMTGSDFTASLYEYSGGGTLAGSPHAASRRAGIGTPMRAAPAGSSRCRAARSSLRPICTTPTAPHAGMRPRARPAPVVACSDRAAAWCSPPPSANTPAARP